MRDNGNCALHSLPFDGPVNPAGMQKGAVRAPLDPLGPFLVRRFSTLTRFQAGKEIPGWAFCENEKSFGSNAILVDTSHGPPSHAHGIEDKNLTHRMVLQSGQRVAMIGRTHDVGERADRLRVRSHRTRSEPRWCLRPKKGQASAPSRHKAHSAVCCMSALRSLREPGATRVPNQWSTPRPPSTPDASESLCSLGCAPPEKGQEATQTAVQARRSAFSTCPLLWVGKTRAAAATGMPNQGSMPSRYTCALKLRGTN